MFYIIDNGERIMNDRDKELDEFFRNYQDRGMLKWAGFFLSDHTLKINKDKQKRDQVYEKREEMGFDEISNVLMQAYAQQLPVSVQLKKLDAELKYQADIEGYVLGFDDNGGVIIDNVDKKRCVALDDINNAYIKTL